MDGRSPAGRRRPCGDGVAGGGGGHDALGRRRGGAVLPQCRRRRSGWRCVWRPVVLPIAAAVAAAAAAAAAAAFARVAAAAVTAPVPARTAAGAAGGPAGPPPSRSLPPGLLRWPMTPAAARVAARGNGRQAAGTAAPIPVYPLAQVHQPHFMSSTNESRCTAATVTSFGHLPVPGRPGVYFIPHRLVQMDGAPCGVAAASAAAGTGRVASTAAEAGRERLSQWTEEEARELLAGPGTLVTRRRNVLSEAAAIAAGTDDLWGIVQTMSNAVGLIGLFDAVDLWVGVERDAPRVCGASAMGAGSVWLWLRLPDGAPVAEIPSIGLKMRAGEQLLFGINERGQRVCAWSRTDADTYVPTPQPTAPPQAQATPKWGSPSCFPAAAAVTRADGSTAAMADVVVGDALRVAVAAAGDAGASRVYMFAHRLVGGTYDFVQLTTSDGAAPTLTLSPGHLVYLADGRLVAAVDVVPGDGLQRAAPLAPGGGGGNGTAAPPAVWVRAAARVQRRGLYNPLTLHGDLIVDGYRVSTFTTAVPPVVGAVLSAPLRALYVLTGLSTTLLEAGVDRLAPLGAAVATVVVAGGGLAVGPALRRRTE